MKREDLQEVLDLIDECAAIENFERAYSVCREIDLQKDYEDSMDLTKEV